MKIQVVSDLFLDELKPSVAKELASKIIKTPADLLVIPSGIAESPETLAKSLLILVKELPLLPKNKCVYVQVDDRCMQPRALGWTSSTNAAGDTPLLRKVFGPHAATHTGRFMVRGLTNYVYGKRNGTDAQPTFFGRPNLTTDFVYTPISKLLHQCKVNLLGYRRIGAGVHTPSSAPPSAKLAFKNHPTYSREYLNLAVSAQTGESQDVAVEKFMLRAYLNDGHDELTTLSGMLHKTKTWSDIVVSTAAPVIHDGLIVPYNKLSADSIGGLYANLMRVGTSISRLQTLKLLIHGGAISTTGVFMATTDGVVSLPTPTLTVANPRGRDGAWVNPTFDPEFVVDLHELGICSEPKHSATTGAAIKDEHTILDEVHQTVAEALKKRLFSEQAGCAVNWGILRENEDAAVSRSVDVPSTPRWITAGDIGFTDDDTELPF